MTLLSHKLMLILVNFSGNRADRTVTFYKIIIWMQTIIEAVFVNFVYYIDSQKLIKK